MSKVYIVYRIDAVQRGNGTRIACVCSSSEIAQSECEQRLRNDRIQVYMQALEQKRMMDFFTFFEYKNPQPQIDVPKPQFNRNSTDPHEQKRHQNDVRSWKREYDEPFQDKLHVWTQRRMNEYRALSPIVINERLIDWDTIACNSRYVVHEHDLI